MASALVDTNLLLLLVVGMTDKAYIATHKRTKAYSEADYDALVSVLDGFDSLWIASHCLAEVSNLLKQTHFDKAKELLVTLRTIGVVARESHIPKDSIFNSEMYLRLGVADTGFVQKARRVSCSFTVDFELYRSISELGIKVVNFNHLRAAYLY